MKTSEYSGFYKLSVEDRLNEVVEFKELNDEQLDKIIGGDSRIRMGFDFSKLFGK